MSSQFQSNEVFDDDENHVENKIETRLSNERNLTGNINSHIELSNKSTLSSKVNSTLSDKSDLSIMKSLDESQIESYTSAEAEQQEEAETINQIMRFLQSNNFEMEEHDDEIEKIGQFREFNKSSINQINNLKTTNILNPLPNFNWNALEECYSFIFNDYISNIEMINNELEQCIRERRAWQEIYFNLDRERSISRINKSERWISAKELQLTEMKMDLKDSISLIKNEFNKFKSLTDDNN